jgi:hypothetical protein
VVATARVKHPFPATRFDARTRGREPSALAAHAGICAGAARKGGPYREHVDARLAFEVLKLLLDDRDDGSVSGYDLTRNAVPTVLARAITSGDRELEREARQYMNELGERGNLGLESEVNEKIGRHRASGDAEAG